jgi:hypothetical protein
MCFVYALSCLLVPKVEVYQTQKVTTITKVNAIYALLEAKERRERAGW